MSRPDPAMTETPNYERVVCEAYFTPAWCVEVLLRHFSFQSVWEPAAGNGAIVRVLRSHDVQCAMSDKTPASPKIPECDFFTRDAMPETMSDIITNPPYNKADEFIEHALNLTRATNGKVSMLLRNEFDSAAKRVRFFADQPAFSNKLCLTKRPRWFKNSTMSPRHNFAWFSWDWDRPSDPPTICWDQ